MEDASSPYGSLGYCIWKSISKRTLIFFRQEKNRLPTVARVLSATLADSTGKIETKAQFLAMRLAFARLLASIATVNEV